MKGIILAGGSGTRLWPITKAISKQLVPVYDKPMIYYPLSTLISAGIRDILIITTPSDQADFQELLGDGSQWGVHLQYAVQPSPDGLAQAFLIGKDFIGNDSVTLVLGDNIFHGTEFDESLRRNPNPRGGVVFAYKVKDPERYGVVEIGPNQRALSIQEKPTHPKSNRAVVGLYAYDNDVVTIAEEIKPSDRGELEITSVNNVYLEHGTLSVNDVGVGNGWFDTGTFESLLEATNYVRTIQLRQDIAIGSPEIAAYLRHFITVDDLLRLAEPLDKSGYGRYLRLVTQQ